MNEKIEMKLIKERLKMKRKNFWKNGFTILETALGMALVAIVLLGLAQLFTLSVMNNLRSDNITNATFLAQQQVDFLRNLTAAELKTVSSNQLDELIDINNDGTCDFRRVTRVHPSGYYWDVDIFVFSAAEKNEDLSEFLLNRDPRIIKAQMSTIIGR